MMFTEIDRLSNTSILITGATGLIGFSFVNQLMTIMSTENISFHIFASGRNLERAKRLFSKYQNVPYFHFVYLDVAKPVAMDKNFDFIIDCAGGASPKLYIENPVEVMESNILGVKNLLDYGVNHKCKKFVYVSSGEVYGEGDGRVFSEEYSGYVPILEFRSCYPMAKRASETLCVSYAKEYGIDISIARPCHVYGPNFTESDNRVYAQIIRNALNNEDIILKSRGEQFRSWCYVDDCASALLYVLLKGKNTEAYNIAGCDSNLSIKEFACAVARQCGRSVMFDIKNDGANENTTPITKAVFSTKKLEMLGWKAHVGLEEGVRRTIEIMREAQE